MAPPGEGESTVTVSTSVPVAFRVGIADHDEARTYRLSEAVQQGLCYQRAILQQPADPESWFSLYELRKLKTVAKTVTVDPLKRDYHFTSIDEAITFVGRMSRECGYKVTRRPNWEHAALLDPVQMATDMGLMTSLVIAEHDWEVSVLHYRGSREGYHEPRFHVVEDGLYTPQSKSMRPRTLSEAVQEPVDADEGIALKWPVKKTLNFDVSSSESGSELSTPPTTRKPRALVDTLMEMTALGRISTDDFAKLIAGLNRPATDRPSPTGTQSHQSVKTEYPSRGGEHQCRARAFSYSRDWSSSIEDDSGLTSQDRSELNDGHGSRKHLTTIIRNVALKTFDGSKTDPEEARQWLSKFLHSANMAGWSSPQRLDAFADNLTNPAHYWHRQLPPQVRNDWKATLNAFHTRLCADGVSPMRLYHALTQSGSGLMSIVPSLRLSGCSADASVPWSSRRRSRTRRGTLPRGVRNSTHLW